MNPLHRALITAVVYIATLEGSDDQEDDDVRVLELISSELKHLDQDAREALVDDVRSLLAKTSDPTKEGALHAILESLSE